MFFRYLNDLEVNIPEESVILDREPGSTRVNINGISRIINPEDFVAIVAEADHVRRAHQVALLEGLSAERIYGVPSNPFAADALRNIKNDSVAGLPLSEIDRQISNPPLKQLLINRAGLALTSTPRLYNMVSWAHELVRGRLT